MKKKKDRYSTFKAMRICDIEQSRFYHWMRDEYLPEGELVKWGRGLKTEFSLFDLYSIALFKEFVDYSRSREVAKRYMNYVDWDFVIKSNNWYMVVKCRKELVKNKDGKYEIKFWEKPEFYGHLVEMALPDPLDYRLKEELISQTALPESIEEREEEKDNIEMDFSEPIEEQGLIMEVAHPTPMADQSESKQPHIGFFIDLKRIIDEVNGRL